MALVLADRVQETTTTSGTGTLTLGGAVSGYQTFSAGIGVGNTTYYTIYDSIAFTWEVGIGTVGSGTLSRDTVLSNSSGTTAKIALAGNTASVFVTYPAEKSVNLNSDGVMEVGDTISYSDTGIISTFASTVAGYNQVILQNKSTATNASANLNVSNDASSASNGFAELGINSSTFSNGPGCFNIPNAAYVASAGADLSIGTYNAYDIHFATNSSTTDAMTIFDNGGTSLGGYGNPGIGNLAVNKIVSGVSTITASAGTTVLTAASTYYQEVVGTTTQTIQLPDATTLLNGTTFIIDNNATGNVTVTDFATSSLDVIPSGGLAYIYLVSNSTVAGTWTAHGYLPSIYNFNNSTADFGNATIINAVWNGTTLAPGYGGTGLTSFTAANNALYSTGASTLTAGTLPIAAGGTGNTTGQAASVANALSAGTGLSYTSGTTYNGSAARTLNLANTAVTPASYTYASITVDAQGRLTAASSGTAPVTSVGATAPVASSGGTTPTISMTQSSSTVNGWLSSTDWSTFNGKQAAYTNLTSIGSLANGTGWLYNNGTGTFSYSTPTKTDVGLGNVTNDVQTRAAIVPNTTPTAGQILVGNAGGTAYAPVSMSSDATLASTGALTLATVNSNVGSFTNASVTVNAKGLVTAVSSGTAPVTSFSAGTTGFTPNTATSGAVTLGGTLGLSNGGTNATTAPAAYANIQGFTTTATAAGSTTLTNTSTVYQQFTGTSTQTIVLPVTSTLTLGWTFHIVNSSTGNLTVNSSGGNLVITVLPNTTAMVTCILTSGTTAASWEAGLTDFGAASSTQSGYLTSTDWTTFNNKGNGTVTSVAALTLGTTGTDLSSTVATGTTTPVITLNVPTASAANRGALSSTDWSTFNNKQAALVSGTNIKTVSGASLLGAGDVGTIGVAYGGTGQTTYTDGQLLIGNSTGNTLTKATLTAGSGISITNGAGAITIAATGGGGGGGLTVSVIGTNTAAAASTLYVLTASLTLTLPASPSVNDQIGVSNLSGTTTAVIARNGQKIMNLSEDMTVDVIGIGFTMYYSGATYGWVIL